MKVKKAELDHLKTHKRNAEKIQKQIDHLEKEISETRLRIEKLDTEIQA